MQQLRLVQKVEQFDVNVVIVQKTGSSKLHPSPGQCENPLDVFEQSKHLVFDFAFDVCQLCACQHAVNLNDVFHFWV